MMKTLNEIKRKVKNKEFVLFLGAGVNSYVVNNGEKCPMSKELSLLIAKDLLKDKYLANNGLDEVAEMARYKLGNNVFDEYIYNVFKKFEPSEAHIKLVQLPWQKIYTTNYDQLIEKASKKENIKIKPIFEYNFDVNHKTQEIFYYKLHGCISKLKQKKSLVITKEDYQEYITYRDKFFTTLKSDILNKNFLFIGYSMKDINFRQILAECYRIRKNKLPRSYSIQKMPSRTQRDFWYDKYNLKIINIDILKFIRNLSK